MASTESPSTSPKPFVFVLMPFSRDFSDIYEFGIKGAAEDVGAYAERVDTQIFDEGILDWVFNQINKADVLVADMTGQNPNVFYEVGYAHALNKVVLLLTQKAEDIPFDLKHRPHIVYGGQIKDLRTNLKLRLKWAIEEAQRRSRESAVQNRLVVSLQKTDLPQFSTGSTIPRILLSQMYKVTRSTNEGLLYDRGFEYGYFADFHIRNEGAEQSETISHVYLLTEEYSPYIPVVKTLRTASKLLPDILPCSKIPSSEQQKLGLIDQFELPYAFNPIPPGAVEVVKVYFYWARQDISPNSSLVPGSSKFSLRLHTRSSYYDYPFILDYAEFPS